LKIGNWKLKIIYNIPAVSLRTDQNDF